MPLILDQETPQPKQRVCAYGDPKTAKTPLLLQLPMGSDYLGEGIYMAADDGAESLRSCPAEMRKFWHVVKPGADPKTGKYDPAVEAWEVISQAMHPGTAWRQKWPKVKTLVWDTMTETGLEVLSHIADSGMFSEKKHITIGDPGGKYTHNLPMQGDYMGAQDSIGRMLKALFKSDLHLFIIFHTAIDEKDNGTVIAGGPATVGKATIRQIAKPFDAVLRLEKKQLFDKETKQTTQAIVVNTEASGIWIGGVRTARMDSPAAINIPMGKPLSAFWPIFFNTYYPEVELNKSTVAV